MILWVDLKEGDNMGRKQHYMTNRERDKLEAYLRAGKSIAWIARELGFCERTIYYEKKRGLYEHDCGMVTEMRYSADKAHQRGDLLQLHRKGGISKNHSKTSLGERQTKETKETSPQDSASNATVHHR